MNVLSLFDGMSCTQIALNRMGIRPSTYFASEIDPYGIKVTQANFPDTIQVGDVTKLKTLHGCLLVEHETDEKSKFTQSADVKRVETKVFPVGERQHETGISGHHF